ncbi:uncharacterized protein LOC126803765 [Argentina anserina]|uniref:uncharacterized protein LOC126803765 n=1 Tax=Argentina anserina TaxID=57926 RepID=UPI0021763FCB|nr:uncharacterized protein LOC126803765 [Potentilla anserina]
MSQWLPSSRRLEGFVENVLNTERTRRYGAVNDVAGNSFVASEVPDGCIPIHLNLVARHGTRFPTEKRMKELDNLALRLASLVKEAEEQKQPLEKVPEWLKEWESPWKGKRNDGQLTVQGEEELYELGVGTRERFQSLFDEDYHPNVYPIKSSQIPRASASAVAFGMGLFSGKGNLGPGKHQAFAVTSESQANDIVLRFHDCCDNYKIHVCRAIGTVKSHLSISLRNQSLEASLLNITNQACALFSPSEGCDGSNLCPLDVFKEKVVAPHLKHDYNAVCNIKGQQEQKPATSKGNDASCSEL